MRTRSRLLAAALMAALLAGCSEQQAPSAAPLEIGEGTTCALDGMLLAHFPGPKAQVRYQGQAEPDYFCDTVEMFAVYLAAEQARVVRALYVQDMGKADWQQPHGHWIDAQKAIYVLGSDAHGSMGPTIASFAQRKDAERFSGEHGGRVLRFDEVTPDMVVLDGGVLNDQKM